jgi:hypothetical protein
MDITIRLLNQVCQESLVCKKELDRSFYEIHRILFFPQKHIKAGLVV